MYSSYLLIIFLLMAATIFAAEEFQPIPDDARARYHFDLGKNFYPNEAAWQKDLDEAKKLAEDLQAYRKKVTSSGQTLYELTQKLERLNLLTQKLYVYRYLQYSVNTKNEPQLTAADQATSEISAKVAFINTELRRISEQDLEKLIAQEPKLALYRFFLQQNTRYQPHTLSTEQEELLASLYPDLFAWEAQIFQKLIDRTHFSEIKTDQGNLNIYRDRQILSKEKNRDVRKEAVLKLYNEYSASADLFGFAFIKQANTSNSIAKLRHFKDAFESSLFDAYLTNEQVESFFRTIEKHADLMKKYIQVRKERIKKISGIDPVEPWDMEVVPPDYKRPRFTIVQTAEILKTALAFHGPEYSADLARLMDPASGRLDIVKGENRRPGAFAWGVYGMPYVFYSFAFHGFSDDVQTMGHEAGHVVHYDLIAQNKVPFAYSDGPSYFTESFAMLNEFEILDYLFQHSSDPEDKIFYLEEWLSVAMRRFFDIVMRSEFEYAAYKKILQNEITDAEQLHQLWKQEGLKYVGEDYQKHDFLKYNWTFTPHFFSSPRYYINYLFANLMAVSYYQARHADPDFDQKYVALMKGGFPDTPINLLKKHLNLNPFDASGVEGAVKIFEAKLSELQKLYASAP
jgi:oligoendopeptidase F